MSNDTNNNNSEIAFTYNKNAERVPGQDAVDSECARPAAPSRPGPQDPFEPHGMN